LGKIGNVFNSSGENIGWNNYPTTSTSYKFRCDVNGANCKGTTANVPWSAAWQESWFMQSSGHRANLLGDWDRFGCAAWTTPYSSTSNSDKKYTCIFARGYAVSSNIDSTAPTLSGLSGSGASYVVGSVVTFTAVATDSKDLLSDGHATLDSGATGARRLASWAYDHTGLSAGFSVTLNTTGLPTGSHTISCRIRDTALRSRAVAITFYLTH
jgi:hypothetical protein